MGCKVWENPKYGEILNLFALHKQLPREDTDASYFLEWGKEVLNSCVHVNIFLPLFYVPFIKTLAKKTGGPQGIGKDRGLETLFRNLGAYDKNGERCPG